MASSCPHDRGPVFATLYDAICSRIGSTDPWLVLPADPQSSDEATRLTYGEACEIALRVSAGFHGRGVVARSRVLVVADNGVDFVGLFLGALLADLVPVPMSPPTLLPSRDVFLDRIARVVGDTSAACVALGDQFRAARDALVARGIPCASFAELAREPPAQPRSTAKADDVAFIQYSSGSTRTPRGAVLSHSNVLWNVHGIGLEIDAGPAKVALCWLPLHHDMGLTGTLLYSLYWGMSLVLLSPIQFVVQPSSWLWAISRFRVVGCASPNFGYALCASPAKVAEDALWGLDLRSWRVAFNGAETVQPKTVRAFERRFAPYGFRPDAMYPVYGLAENTVAACFPPHGRAVRLDHVDRRALEVDDVATAAPPEAESTRAIVSVGRPLAGQTVRVVGRHGDPLPERRVGAIQVGGRCVMTGYLGDPRATADAKTADGWLFTGDLGYLAGGELYVVGREKEIVKRAGAKYDAADMQAVVGDVAGVRAGCVAVFSSPDERAGTESIIVLAELRRGHPAAELEIVRTSVAREVHRVFAIRPDEVVLVGAGTLPKSTSGKIMVVESRRMYLEGELP